MHHGRILARYILKLYLGQGFVKGASGAEGQGIMVHGLGFGEPYHSVGNQHADDQGNIICPAMVNPTTSTREVIGAFAAVVKKAAMPTRE